MERIAKIKEHYNLTSKDEERLRSLAPLMEKYADDCISHFHRRIAELNDPVISEKIKTPSLHIHHRGWFTGLFSGIYDHRYHQHLLRVGKTHAQIDIKTHFVSVALNSVREFVLNILSENFEDQDERTELKITVNKILDINLDILTSSYIEEEIKIYSAAYKVKSALVNFAEKFSSAMNLVLVLLLILITLGVVALFFYDVVGLFRGDFSKGLISALGSLLILWVMIELMNTEIDHLKGGKFNISVFIGVALVTFIRDLMIITLKHEETKFQYYLAGVTLILGAVYWLIKKTEEKRTIS